MWPEFSIPIADEEMRRDGELFRVEEIFCKADIGLGNNDGIEFLRTDPI